MAKPYRLNEAQVCCEAEAVPGTAETPAAADMVLVENFKFTPTYGNAPNNSMGGGVFSKSPGASGVQTGTVSFDVVMKGSGAAGTAPEWRDLIMMCGFSETIVGATSVTYAPAAPEAYYTMSWIVPGLGAGGEDMLHRLAGCQANAKFTFKAGDLRRMNVSATGIIAAPSDSTILSAPTWDTTAPTAFLNDAAVIHGSTLAFETLEIDMGQEIAYRPNANSATGGLTAQITSRRPTGTVDIEAEKLSTFNIYTRITANTLGALAMTPVATAGNKVALNAPNIRFTGVDHADRAGALVWQAAFECLRSANAGNDEVQVVLT
jgi:hypothetical protein